MAVEAALMPLRHLRAMFSSRLRPVELLDMLATFDRILENGVTVARFGDGELKIALAGRGLSFQPASRHLVDSLNAALLQPKPGYLACYNSQFMQADEWQWIAQYERYEAKEGKLIDVRQPQDVLVLQRKKQANEYRRNWRVVAAETEMTAYGAAGVFYLGLYLERYRAGRIQEVVERFRRLFRGRRILFVCPDKPMGGLSFREQVPLMQRLGVTDAQFVSIPERDAFAMTEDVMAQIKASVGFDDIFLQAGPAASVWAHMLAGRFEGRVLDVGSLNTQLRYLE